MLLNDPDYLAVVDEVKARITAARHRAMVAVNAELVLLYWDVGNIIDQHREWGSAFVPNLARDIQAANPQLRGFSIRNLKYMAAFAVAYPDREIVQTLSAQLSWSHHVMLLEKVKDPAERQWYTEQVIQQGWSVRRLDSAINDQIYQRQVLSAKTTNYAQQLVSPQREQALDLLKDPYIFDFIDYREGMVEREVESELVRNITKFLIELGSGFAFLGQQYPISVSGKDYRIDLLFYHTKLHCYVVVELKNTDFKPEHAGQLNFYVSAVDDTLATSDDNPTIGILLVRRRDGLTAEYAFRGMTQPIGISEYRLLDTLPAEYENLIPSPADIEARLGLRLTSAEDTGHQNAVD